MKNSDSSSDESLDLFSENERALEEKKGIQYFILSLEFCEFFFSWSFSWDHIKVDFPQGVTYLTFSVSYNLVLNLHLCREKDNITYFKHDLPDKSNRFTIIFGTLTICISLEHCKYFIL